MKYCIAQGHDEVPYPLFGVNVELATWLWAAIGEPNSDSIVRVAFEDRLRTREGPEELKDSLRVILGGSLGHDFAKAEKLMYDHWHHHVELGPYPCPYMLAEYQSKRAFYAEYRDHVAHQFKVYLLGLYIFDHCEEVRKSFVPVPGNDEDALRKEFCLRWLATALAHDVGYLLENEVDSSTENSDKNQLRKRFVDHFNKLLAYPLLSQVAVRGVKFEKAEHDQLVGELNTRPHLRMNPGKKLVELCNSALGQYSAAVWARLEKDAIEARLTKNGSLLSSPLSAYYRFACENEDCHKVRLLDHGINSALLLMAAWYAYRDAATIVVKNPAKLQAARRYNNGVETFPLWAEPVESPNESRTLSESDESRMLSVSAAIALHNIDPSRFDKVSAFSEHQLSDKFLIDRTKLPLAFLLRLADTLQDWDRQKFRPLRDDERLLESRDFSLRAVTKDVVEKEGWAKECLGKLALFYRTEFTDDEAEVRPGYEGAVRDLQKCLSKEDVERLVCFDGTVRKGKRHRPDSNAAAQKANSFELVPLDPPPSSERTSIVDDATLPSHRPPHGGDGGAGDNGNADGNGGGQPIKEGGKPEPWLVPRIRNTLIDPEGDPHDSKGIGTCARLKSRCDVIWQSAHLAADYVCVSRASLRLVNALVLFNQLLDWKAKFPLPAPNQGEALRYWITGLREPLYRSFTSSIDQRRKASRSNVKALQRVTTMRPVQPGEPVPGYNDAPPTDEIATWAEETRGVLARLELGQEYMRSQELCDALQNLLTVLWRGVIGQSDGSLNKILAEHSTQIETLRGSCKEVFRRLRGSLMALPADVHTQLSRRFELPLDNSLGGRLKAAIESFTHHQGKGSPWHEVHPDTVPDWQGGQP